MAGNVFDAIVQAVDRASGPFRAIAQSMQGLVHAQQAVNQQSARGVVQHAAFTQVLGGHVSLLQGHFSKLGSSIGAVGSSISQLMPMLAGLGAVGSIAGLFGLAEHAAENFAHMNAAAQKIGHITIPELQGLRTAAQMADVPIESMEAGMLKLNRTIGLAVGGKSKDAVALFRHLGISLKDSHGQTINAVQALPALADAFAHTTDDAVRARAAVLLFGRAGQEMIPFLLEGRAGLREFSELSARVNFAPIKQQQEGLEAFHRSWIGLKLAAQGFLDEVGTKLAPVLAPVVQYMRDWVAENRKWISDDIVAAVKPLAEWIRKLDLKAVIQDFETWGGRIKAVADHLGGTKLAIGLFVLAIGAPVIGPLFAVTAAFVSLTAAVLASNAALLSNPFVIVAAAIVALGVVIYMEWDKISANLTATWRALVAAASWTGNMIGTAFTTAFTWLDSQIRAIFTGLYDWFTSQPAWVQALLTTINPVLGVPMTIIEAWDPLKAFFTDLWASVKNAFAEAWSYIEPIVAKMREAADFIATGWVGRQLGLSGGGTPQLLPGGRSPADDYTPFVDDVPGTPNYGIMPSRPPAGGTPTAPAAGGTSRIQIDINNLPPGWRVRSDSSGSAPAPNVNVGYADPMALAY